MATHSSILAWEISCTEERGGLQSMRSQRVGHKTENHHHHHSTEHFYSDVPKSEAWVIAYYSWELCIHQVHRQLYSFNNYLLS